VGGNFLIQSTATQKSFNSISVIEKNVTTQSCCVGLLNFNNRYDFQPTWKLKLIIKGGLFLNLELKIELDKCIQAGRWETEMIAW
jgi:hypothetical protein